MTYCKRGGGCLPWGEVPMRAGAAHLSWLRRVLSGGRLARDDMTWVLRAAHMVQLSVVALLAIGVIMVQSAAMSVASAGHSAGSPDAMRAILTSRQVVYAGIAIGVMLLASRINVRHVLAVRMWWNPLLWGFAAAVALTAATLVPGVGRTINGAARWLTLGPASWGVTFQPSELVKWLMVILLAWWAARRRMDAAPHGQKRAGMRSFTRGLGPAVLVVAVGCGIILVEDLGTAVLIAAVAGCLLLAGGARVWHMIVLSLPAAVAVAMAIWWTPYRLQRLLIFMDPWSDPRGGGYHAIQSMLAFAEGGVTGRGLGNSIQKFYLPQDTNDFLFPIICEELGLVGAALVVCLYVGLVWLALGIMLTLGMQALLNIAVVTVVVPTKGIALPLISAGGTGWIVTAGMLGLLAALDNASALEEGTST